SKGMSSFQAIGQITRTGRDPAGPSPEQTGPRGAEMDPKGDAMLFIALKVGKRTWLAWLLIVIFFIAGCARAHKPTVQKPIPQPPISHQDACSERTVFVGEMGNDEDVPRFRILLEKSLREEGFTVVPDRQQA